MELKNKYLMFSKMTKLHFKRGSIFETEEYGVDAIIISIIPGLTCLKMDAYKFVKQFDKPINYDWGFVLFENQRKDNSLKTLDYVLMDGRRSARIYSLNDVRIFVDIVLSKMSELNAKKIAMNAVKTKRFWGDPEMILVEAVKFWLMNNSHSFEEIYFIDKRGGFSGGSEEVFTDMY
jgi:hypothetical protein